MVLGFSAWLLYDYDYRTLFQGAYMFKWYWRAFGVPSSAVGKLHMSSARWLVLRLGAQILQLIKVYYIFNVSV